MKIGIGTAQFGLNYGISNKEGKTEISEVINILNVASQNNIRVIDTAAMYGSSEDAIGVSLPHINYHFDVVTKTPKFSSPAISEDDIYLFEDTFFKSLSKLKQPYVYGLLIHDSENLRKPNGNLFLKKMMEFKQEGLVKKVGVSVYTGDQIDYIIGEYEIDLIQLPMNILDQRLLLSGHLTKLKKANVEIHIRSVFLQGLLLMNPEGLSSYFNPVKPHIKEYHDFIKEKGISPLQAALGFVLCMEDVDTAICGINNHLQLKEICNAATFHEYINYDRFAITDEAILNPSKWRN